MFNVHVTQQIRKMAVSTLIHFCCIFTELSSQSTRNQESPARESVHPLPPLNYIPGLEVPAGLEIRYRRDIIAVNQTHVILPYMKDGAYTILKPKPRDPRNPKVTEFEAEHITEEEWLITVARWATEAEVGSWAVDSAITTIQRIHLDQIAAKRGQHNIIQQSPLVHHLDTPVDQQGLRNFQPARLGFRMNPHERSDTFDLPRTQLLIGPHESEGSDASPTSSSSEHQSLTVQRNNFQRFFSRKSGKYYQKL